ncbi:PilW family protein [Chromohalobacter sarecensis]|uniref:PilW family protein n=1 Tax=Chromohalobacter sarecensis TaxID=245294 RepID=A0ABV9CXJ1_9GAMM|nr:prepilin-type N-terminal cleavage/methylation domain-containing protein [Chromohalobacter sarecensis]MCK0716150.1 prepilin-type N-terminal cleavage/methylation domain-containing protein [Chromohalobacter sarecensis]
MTNQYQRGFTLIETMISMLLGLIILGGTITAYQMISDLREQRDAYYQLQDELMYIHRELSSTVKVAKSVEIKDKGDSLLLNSYPVDDKIECPSFDDGSDYITWMEVGGDNNDRTFKCKAGDERKGLNILPLHSEGNASEEEGAEERAGISSISFECPSYESCGPDEKLKSVVAIVDYYDRKCDPDNKSCKKKTLNFHLSTRNPEG